MEQAKDGGERRATDVNGNDAGDPAAAESVAPRRPLRLAAPRPDGESPGDLVAAFEVAPDPIALVDASGGLVRWNGAWERELAYAPADLEGASFGTLVHDADRAALEVALEQVTSRRLA